MAITPPQGGSDGPESVEFGIAALNARLAEAGVQFPATSTEICSGLGDTTVAYDAAGNTLDLKDALADVEGDRFASETELLDALYPVFESHRRRAASSVVARLRSLLPV